ncbi:UDP-N-acetylmuramoyl-tripeptide--D-alanyl-D-alanine ligase [Sphingobacterium spiritivorum]|uniref:UDP-N-acetylmuramoyl-tripeptide--D-alanyl-D-alanine ligase n=1 Tax=Sphingobacterium spiritivorum TaxID=258 RepID=A0A380C9L2_SPHSI|nr:UDP-N-acetylmuramoyl-tripeptide--D-alanyl-D-alanine ligase [Sphingobacterium spiritivorum]SUJ14557.1 UDP-N-acetylmuramoyl-tripeptide--D-alanyl-D-alanine ligase [Sphingobacterium spiritivorum]
MTTEALYDLYLQHPYVSTDTRNILPGSLFFALKGANFNGNSFADQALQTGASYVIIDEATYAKDGRYILVDNVLESLQKLANHHRKTLSIPVIGVTGTNGKTTTKELLHATLSQKFKTYSTKGNLNNHIGVPLTLLSVDSTIQIAVIEMGANHLKEIAFLCDIAEPTHGLISNVGKAHLEGFGSFEGVKKTKGELYDYLQNHNGTLFLQADNPHLNEMAATRKISEVVTYGFAETNDVIGKLLKADPLLQIEWKEKDKPDSYTVHTQLTGSYNTENFLAAIAVGLYFGVSAGQINTGIERYIPKNNRSQVTKTEHNTIIADYYNANASSMAAALDNIEVIDASRKVIILGDMFEMGDESDAEHEKVVQRAKSIGADRLIFVGKAFRKQAYLEAEFYETSEEAKQALIDRPVINSTILLKASRGMAFEHLMDVL